MPGRGRIENKAEIQAAYLDWLMTPPGERDPSGKQAFADLWGVSLRTLYNWEDSDDFVAQLTKLKSKWGARWHGEILGRLFKIVQEGADSNAISASKVLLQHLRLDTAEADADEMDDERVLKVREALKQAGITVIERNE